MNVPSNGFDEMLDRAIARHPIQGQLPSDRELFAPWYGDCESAIEDVPDRESLTHALNRQINEANRR